ncbi:hypothetical protein [Amycolatopsis sp. M39]|uniref:hypothetical protein n=1 Tax=Amycolatopsis sp. M39 TaxID=1825094 RepID=UPI0012FFB87A|nr:hypothetical protein [Amycolatopsis sp. M39]
MSTAVAKAGSFVLTSYRLSNSGSTGIGCTSAGFGVPNAVWPRRASFIGDPSVAPPDIIDRGAISSAGPGGMRNSVSENVPPRSYSKPSSRWPWCSNSADRGGSSGAGPRTGQVRPELGNTPNVGPEVPCCNGVFNRRFRRTTITVTIAAAAATPYTRPNRVKPELSQKTVVPAKKSTDSTAMAVAPGAPFSLILLRAQRKSPPAA